LRRSINVDDLLAILIPEIPVLPGLEKRQEIRSWGGQDHPQEPITYYWGPYVEFRMSRLPTYLWNAIPDEYRKKEWLVLDVNGSALDLFELEVNGQEVDWDSRPLDAVLDRLLSQHNRWVLIFEPHYDQIDSVYRLTVSESLQKLRSNYLRAREKEGFIILGRSQPGGN
jgi:hypothetical protein